MSELVDRVRGFSPTRCPRCERASDEWSIERRPRSRYGLAGCRCGDVIEITFAAGQGEGENVEERLVASGSKKPARWVEVALPGAWRATLTPGRGQLVYVLPLFFALRLAKIFVAVRLDRLVIGYVVFLVGMLAFTLVACRRKWRFSVEASEFRASARGHQARIPLDELSHFGAERTSPNALGAQELARFQLCAHRANGTRLRVPLFVSSDDEARFVAERLNAALSAEGRSVDGGYRGRLAA
jgi:hypothetical protein